MHRRLRVALIACFITLYSAAALAVPVYALNPPQLRASLSVRAFLPFYVLHSLAHPDCS